MRPPAAKGQPTRRLALYRVWGRLGLSAIAAGSTALTLILVGIVTSACSMPRSDRPFAWLRDKEATGSIPAHTRRKEPTESDLAFARNAVSDVLSKGDKDASQHWENPETGACGSVTPLADTYSTDDGRSCRDFLASYVNGETEGWLQGAACRTDHGSWEVKTLRSWRRA